jgi:hypothetical protein
VNIDFWGSRGIPSMRRQRPQRCDQIRRDERGTPDRRPANAPAGSYSQITKCRKSRESVPFQAWAQAVVDSRVPSLDALFLRRRSLRQSNRKG